MQKLQLDDAAQHLALLAPRLFDLVLASYGTSCRGSSPMSIPSASEIL